MAKTLLVFIHGFMGSAQSFLNFGKDIQLYLKDLEIDVLHYEYETKGNNALQVLLLIGPEVDGFSTFEWQ